MIDKLEKQVKIDLNIEDDVVIKAKTAFVYARLRQGSQEAFEEELELTGDIDMAVSKAVINDFIVDALEYHMGKIKEHTDAVHSMLEETEADNDKQD